MLNLCGKTLLIVNGGCFSFKVSNKVVVDVWKELFYAMCGETLFKTKNMNNKVTGIHRITQEKLLCS